LNIFQHGIILCRKAHTGKGEGAGSKSARPCMRTSLPISCDTNIRNFRSSSRADALALMTAAENAGHPLSRASRAVLASFRCSSVASGDTSSAAPPPCSSCANRRSAEDSWSTAAGRGRLLRCRVPFWGWLHCVCVREIHYEPHTRMVSESVGSEVIPY
jgi:hypothetical protein